MYSFKDDSTEFSFTSGSNLLGESPLQANQSDAQFSLGASLTGPGGADLSLSELSLSRDNNILSAPQTPSRGIQEDLDDDDEHESAMQGMLPDRHPTREDKLRHDLNMLKSLNATFTLYNETLRTCQSASERVSEQLNDTDQLLNKYLEILRKSDKVTRLIFDPAWSGADAV